ncbi:hypothetical protein NADE_000807 [Nannochloris sp. 'desiccata']|nr:hypothetical protein NADE_000807 [Chlorella desiccata (nom. nud.)]
MNEVRRAVRKAFQNQDGHLIPVVFYESRFGLVRIYNLRHTLDGQPLELTVPLDIRGEEEEEEEEGERAPAPAYTTTSRPQGGLAPSSAPVVVAVTNLPATTPSATPLGASAPVAMVSLGTKLLLLHWTSPLLFVSAEDLAQCSSRLHTLKGHIVRNLTAEFVQALEESALNLTLEEVECSRQDVERRLQDKFQSLVQTSSQGYAISLKNSSIKDRIKECGMKLISVMARRLRRVAALRFQAEFDVFIETTYDSYRFDGLNFASGFFYNYLNRVVKELHKLFAEMEKVFQHRVRILGRREHRFVLHSAGVAAAGGTV